MASSSEQLGAQAQALRDLVGQFTTGNGQSGPAAASKAPAAQAKPQKGKVQSGQERTAKAVAV
jgi:hypothetical protein